MKPLLRIDDAEWAGVRAAAGPKDVIGVRVSSCAYSCCGRPWQRRNYEAVYHGYVDNFEEREGEKAGTFMLYSMGIGTVSYVIACRDFELLEVLP